MSTTTHIIAGNLVHAPRGAGYVEYVVDGYIEYDMETGRIVKVGRDSKDLEKRKNVTRLNANAFLVPGFVRLTDQKIMSHSLTDQKIMSHSLISIIPHKKYTQVDLHVHAPQFAFHGTGTDLQLMKWLETYTFPSEARMKDTERAMCVYDALVKRLLRNGTTTAMYFATQHLEATKKLADICGNYGQRAFVGKVTQDINSPPDYVETTSNALKNTEKFIQYCLGSAGRNGLIRPVITPRFVPTCSQDLLSGLGRLAKKYEGKVWIQSHAAESRDEEEWVAKMNIDGVALRDTAIFEKHGLLGNRTVMAHCTHLKDDELKVFSTHSTSIAHCPLSNFFFSHRTLNLRRCEKFNVRTGLGTDIAGGYASSILSNIRHAVVASRSLSHHHDEEDEEEDVIDFKHAFWLATTGGAKALNMSSEFGFFKVGLSFDALLIQFPNSVEDSKYFAYDKQFLSVQSNDGDEIGLYNLKDAFQRFINLGDDRNISKVWVRGKLINI